MSLCVPYLTYDCVQAKRRAQHQNYKSLLVPALTCGFCMQNSDFWTRITGVYWTQTSPVILCTQNSAFMTRITNLYGSQTSPVDLCMQNSVLTTDLYGSQTSPVDLSMQNSVLITRNTSHYGSQLSSVVFE